MVNHKDLLFWIALFLLFLLFLITVSIVAICRIRSNRLHYIVFPLFYFLSSIVFFVFIPGQIFQQIYIFISSFLFGAMLFYVGNFILGHTEVRKTFRHYTLFDIVVLVCGFFSYCALFGLYLFLSWPIWLLFIGALVISFFLSYYYFWYNKMAIKKNLIYYFIFSLIILEATWAITFWSTGFLARGMVLFIIFYTASGLAKHNHQKTLTSRIVKEYLATTIIALALVLGTTKWTF